MKQKVIKELLQFIYAILIGLAVEAVYFAVIEYVNYYWEDPTPFDLIRVFFLIYIAAVGILVAIVISKYCKRTGNVTGTFKVLTALCAGTWLHMMILKHDTVVYYHMHGEFYPMSDDLGFFFFMTYLGLVYLIWMPEAIFFVIKNLIKRD